VLLFKGRVTLINIHIKTYEELTPMSEAILFEDQRRYVLVKYDEYISDSDTQPRIAKRC